MDEKDTSHNRPPSVSLTDAQETPAGESRLGQRIWGRYGSSPGVIPLDSVLQRVRYTTQFGINRLPLLADVQRRWSRVDAHITHAWPAIPYVQRTASSSESDNDTPSPYAPGSEARRLPRTQDVPSSGPGIQQDRQPEGGPSGFTFKEGLRKADRPTGRREPPTGSAIEQGRTETEGEITTPAAIDTDSGGVQYRVSGPAGRALQHALQHAVQQQGVGSSVQMQAGPRSPRRATLQRLTGAAAPEGHTVQKQPHVPKPAGAADQKRADDRPAASSPPVHPSAGTDLSITKDENRSFAAASTGDVGGSTLQRHRDGSVEQTARGEPGTQESGAKVKTRISSDVIAGNLRTSILQRHMSSPAERVLQYKAGYQAMEIRTATPRASGQGGRGDPAIQGHPASSEPSSELKRSAAATGRAATAGSRDLGASLVRRYLGGPFELAWRGPPAPATPGTQPFFVDTDTPQSPPAAKSGHMTSRVQAAPFGATGLSGPTVNSLQRRVDDADSVTPLKPDVRGTAYPEVSRMQPGTALSGSAAQRAEVSSSRAHTVDTLHPPWPEMPLLAGAADYSSAGAKKEGTPWVQQRRLVVPAESGGTLQRALGGASGETPTAESPQATLPQDIGGSPPPSVNQPDLEGPELERLADQVYTIIERRLIVEKENRGL